MEEQTSKEHFFKDIKNLLVDYLQNRLELTRMTVFEKIAKIMALLFSIIILTMLLFFTILFISIMAGFYFGKLFNNMFDGFAIIAMFYLVSFIVLFVYRKALIEKHILNAVIRILFKEKDEAK